MLLITNVASACGYTEQNYVGLEALYQKYGRFGLEILAFPSNQFGGQEPGSEATIKAYAQQHYGVTFRMMSKVDVNGPNEHPVFECAALLLRLVMACHLLTQQACLHCHRISFCDAIDQLVMPLAGRWCNKAVTHLRTGVRF